MRMAMLLALVLMLTLHGSSPGPAMNQLRPAPSAPIAWVQLTGAGQEVRAISEDGHCPPLELDGGPRPMAVRAPAGPDFPVTTCSAPVPAGARFAAVNGRRLPLMTAPPRTILVFGDTGCRLRGDQIQDCNNAASWPFPAVARLAAAHRPDLVIHVGDYYYRESACPAGRAGCVGSPHGDGWDSWRADFFDPARPLLLAAPFVFARGNHELCDRGGQGWTRFLDAGAEALSCANAEAPFKVDLGGVNLYVIDSASSEDRSAPPDDVARVTRQLDALGPDLATAPGWIVTHRPIWAVTPFARVGSLGPAEISLDKTLQAAVRGRDLAAVDMIVSGHIHHFAAYSFGRERPAQLVVGTGGDIGEPGDTPKYRAGSPDIDGMTAQGFAFERYGFLILERGHAGWRGVFYDMNDRIVARCSLVGRDLACAPPGKGARGDHRDRRHADADLAR